jgi:hypothetical protein
MAKGKYYAPEFEVQAVKMVVEASHFEYGRFGGTGTGC